MRTIFDNTRSEPSVTLHNTDTFLPEAAFFQDARFIQNGDDLVLILPSGLQHTVEDYFSAATTPTLTGTFSGISYSLDPATVSMFLERPIMQAQSQNTPGEVVGTITDATGEVIAVAPGGTRRTLETDSLLYEGEVLETGDSSSVKVVMLDQTLFSLGSDARMAVNDLNYNADSNSGNSSFAVLKGGFLFVSGLIAKNNPSDMEVTTPVGTIGIRGTIVAGEIDDSGFTFSVIDGAIEFTNNTGGIFNLDESFESLGFDSEQQETTVQVKSLRDLLVDNAEAFGTLDEDELAEVAQAVSKTLSEAAGVPVQLTMETTSENVQVAAETADQAIKEKIEGSESTVVPIPEAAEEPTAVESDLEELVAEPLAEEEPAPEQQATQKDPRRPEADTIAPDAPVLSWKRAADSPLIEISATSEKDATLEFSRDSGVTWKSYDGTNADILASEGQEIELIARQTDLSNNVSEQSNSVTFTYDATPPEKAPTFALDQDTGVQDGNLSSEGRFTITNLPKMEADATLEYKVTKTGAAGTNVDWSPVTTETVGGVKKAYFDVKDDGEYTLQTRQTDAAGNSTYSTTTKFTLDSQKPATPAFALDQDTGVQDGNLSSEGRFNITNLPKMEADASLEYKITKTGAAGTNVDWSPVTTETVGGVKKAYFDVKDDGEYTLQTRQTDAAGNTATSASVSFTLDTTLPAKAPTFALDQDTGSKGDDLLSYEGRFTITNLAEMETDTVLEYKITKTGAAGKNVDWSPVTTETVGGVKKAYFDVKDDGEYTLQTRQTDAAGNSIYSTTTDFTLDTTDPTTAPTITLSVSYHGAKNAAGDTTDSNYDANNPNPTTGYLGTNQAIQVSGLEDGARWEYNLTGQEADWTPGTGNSFQLENGQQYSTIKIRQIDAAGNTGPESDLITLQDTKKGTTYSDVASSQVKLYFDTSAVKPAIVLSTATRGQIDIENLEDSATWEYRINGGQWVDGQGSSVQVSENDQYSMQVRQTDKVGNTSSGSNILSFNYNSTDTEPILALYNNTADTTDLVTKNTKIISSYAGSDWQYRVDNGEWKDLTEEINLASNGSDDGENKIISLKEVSSGNITQGLKFTLDTTKPSAPTVDWPQTTKYYHDFDSTLKEQWSGKIDSNENIIRIKMYALNEKGQKTGSAVAVSNEIHQDGRWEFDTDTVISIPVKAVNTMQDYAFTAVDHAGNESSISNVMTVIRRTGEVEGNDTAETFIVSGVKNGITKITANAGNDVMGTLGAEAVQFIAGADNDEILMSSAAYQAIRDDDTNIIFDGGEDQDTLLLDEGVNTIDLTNQNFKDNIKNIENIFIENVSYDKNEHIQSLKLDAATILNMTDDNNILRIKVSDQALNLNVELNPDFTSGEKEDGYIPYTASVGQETVTVHIPAALKVTGGFTDNIKPDAPTVDLGTDSTSGTVMVTDLEGGASVQFSLDGTNYYNAKIDSSNNTASFAIASKDYGVDSQTLHVKQIDAAGNESLVTTETVNFPIYDSMFAGSDGNDRVTIQNKPTVDIDGMRGYDTLVVNYDAPGNIAITKEYFTTIQGFEEITYQGDTNLSLSDAHITDLMRGNDAGNVLKISGKVSLIDNWTPQETQNGYSVYTKDVDNDGHVETVMLEPGSV